MAEEQKIGRAVVEVDADATGLSAGLASAEQTVRRFDKEMERAGKSIAGAYQGVGEAGAQSAEKVDAASQRVLRALEREVIMRERGRAGWLEYQAAQKGVGAEAAPLIDRLRASEAAVGKVGMSAKQTAQAMRLLPAQITDIVTGLVSGQPAYLVAIQQGGQLKDSFGGITPTIRALLSTLSPLRIALGVTGTAIAAIAYATVAASREIRDFDRALVMSGNMVGKTTDQLRDMAREVGSVTGSRSQAAAAIAEIAKAGIVTGETMDKVAESIVRASQVTGKSAKELVGELSRLEHDPVRASIELNKEYRHLTASIFEQIIAFQKSGDMAAAAHLAQSAYLGSLVTKSEELTKRLGWIERGWNAIKAAASDAISAAMSAGADGPADKLRNTEKALANARELAARGDKTAAQRVRELEVSVEAFRKAVAAEEEAASKQGEATRKEQEAVAKLIADYRNLTRTVAERTSEGERLLRQYKEREALMRGELDADSKLGSAAQDRVRLESRLAEIKERGSLSADEKSLVAQESLLRAQLARNEALEQEVEMRRLISDALARDERREQQAKDRSAALTQNLQNMLDARRAQQSSQLLGLGDSSEAMRRIQEQFQIRREFSRVLAQETTRAARDGMLGSEAYDESVRKIQSALDTALEDHRRYYAAIDAARANAEQGMSKGVGDYLDTATNVVKQTADAFTGGFRQAEDALTKFVTTGKGGIRELVDFVRSEVIRMSIQRLVTVPLAQMLMGLGGPSAGAMSPAQQLAAGVRPMASGGVLSGPTLIPTSSGTALAGEAGYEAVLPLARGPDGVLGVKSGGSSSGDVHIAVNIDSRTDRAEVAMLARRGVESALAKVMDARRRGTPGMI